MKEHGFEPDVNIFDLLIKQAGMPERFETAYVLWVRIFFFLLPLSLNNHFALINSFGAVNRMTCCNVDCIHHHDHGTYY
jgi:hypothetical protein